MGPKQLDRIESKLDILDSRLDKMDLHMAKYNSELEFHIARTNQIEDALVPVVEHVKGVDYVLRAFKWVIGTILAIAGLVVTIWSVK